MYTLHPEFMPKDLQEHLIADLNEAYGANFFSSLGKLASTEAATEWFLDTVRTIEPAKEFAYVDRKRFKGSEYSNGESISSDFHTDSRGASTDKMKFLVVVANNKRTGTIFVDNEEMPNTFRTNRGTLRSEHVFCVDDSDELALRPDVKFNFTWKQAAVGQICSFDLASQVHAAAPQFPGDLKILFATTSR